MMLCESCQHQATCLLPQWATHDRQVQTMLDKLQVCEMYVARFPSGVSCGDALRRLWALVQARLTGAAEGMGRVLTEIFKETVCHRAAAKH